MTKLRTMGEFDIPMVLSLQSEAYGEAFNEAESVLRSRLASAPETAWVAEDASGVCGYLFGYRSELGKATPLGGEFHIVPDGACLYLHDLAIARRAGGYGLGKTLVRHAIEYALRTELVWSALISVQNTRDFWAGLGYAVAEFCTWQDVLEKLESYPKPAFYMLRSLP